MNEVITIEGTEMQVKEYAGQRVVTFKDIDKVHQRPEGTARKRFNDNRGQFIEGEDYFVVKPEDFRMSENRTSETLSEEINNRGTFLITESGYLMLVKSFTDDLAWKVQRNLVNSYFKVKKEQDPSTSQKDSSVPLSSDTPIPLLDWYSRNKRRIWRICEHYELEPRQLYHILLKKIGQIYDLEKANEIYMQETGHLPEYAMDVISYFHVLGNYADVLLDDLE